MQSLLARLKNYKEPSGSEVEGLNGAIEATGRFDDDRHLKTSTPVNSLASPAALRTGSAQSQKRNIPQFNVQLPDGVSTQNIESTSDTDTSLPTDDALEIEIVMATNKTPTSKGRQRKSTSSPRALRKTSRIRGSRGSRLSVSSAASDRDDGQQSVFDSEDEADTARPQPLSPYQAWAAFEHCVKNIATNNPDYFTKKPKPNFLSSGDFQRVMVDMYGNTEYGNTKGYTLLKQKLNNMAKATGMASRMMFSAINKGQQDREEEEARLAAAADGGESGNDEPDMASHPEAENVTVVLAKRGWKMLKRQVNETAMEHKIQSTKLNWAMLQHTLKQMSNTEKTRQDLYERYGVVPTTLEDGSVVCENRMLSERARAQIYGRSEDGKTYRRPMSYQPPSVHIRSRSQLSTYSNKSGNSSLNKPGHRLGNKSVKRTNDSFLPPAKIQTNSHRKPRPGTAVK